MFSTRRKVSTQLMTTARLVACAPTALIAFFGASATAQAPEANDASDDIVVTATRTPTAQERLPARVTVIDREAIEDRGYVSLVDALREAPGIVAVQNGTPGSLTSVFSRGTNSKHTLALYDGIRLNDASTPNGQYNFGQDLLGDLERVEVLRGPASSIYGSDAIGGVINLIPRRGAETPFEGYYDVSLGDLETRRGSVGAAGSLGSLSYGVSLEAFESEGFDQIPERFALRTGDPDGATITTISATARYTLTDSFSIDGLIRFREATSEFDTFSGGPTFSLRADDPDLEVDYDRYTVGRLGADWRLSDGLSVRASFGRMNNERAETNGGVRTSSAEGERSFTDLIGTFAPASGGLLRNPAVTAGVQWFDDEIDVPATAFSGRLARSESNTGYFLVAQSGFGNQLDVTASVRTDDNEAFGDNTTYNLGFVYNLESWGLPLRFLASHGTSFKAPTLNERFSTSAFNIGNAGLAPEEGRSTEFGFDVVLEQDADHAIEFGATYFDSTIRNLIEYNFAQLRNVNIGRVEIEGYEAYFRGRTDIVSLQVAYTYTETVNALLASRPQLLRRPENVWSAQANFTPTDQINLAFTWNAVGSRTDVNYSNAGAFLRSGGRIDGYQIASATLTYHANDAVSLYATVNNLTDETYEQPEAFAGAPRTVSIGLRGRF